MTYRLFLHDNNVSKNRFNSFFIFSEKKETCLLAKNKHYLAKSYKKFEGPFSIEIEKKKKRLGEHIKWQVLLGCHNGAHKSSINNFIIDHL